MKKIMVTGATGFIGSNLLEHFIKTDNKIVAIDKDFNRLSFVNGLFKTNQPQYYSDSNKLSKNFTMIWDDIKNLKNYHYATDEVDTVYHLAAASDIKKSFSDPTWDLVENVMRTHDVLEFMRRNDVPNLIFSSTSVVHGNDAPKPTPEEGIDFRPISQYAASKIACEVFIHAYCHIYGLKAWIFRFGNVVGKYQHRGVIYDFINKLEKNPKKLEILGDGKQVKSYFHVSDCINAITTIPKKDNNKSSIVYNLATYDYMDVKALADIVCQELKLKPKYQFTGGDHGWVGDVPQVVLSIEKALSTGWKPKYNCKEAIRKTVKELC